jgi:hypothetical protein
MTKIELRTVHSDLPDCFAVFDGDDDLGDIERLPDGTWIGDVTKGIAAPSRPFATQAEAIEYVVSGWRQ